MRRDTLARAPCQDHGATPAAPVPRRHLAKSGRLETRDAHGIDVHHPESLRAPTGPRCQAVHHPLKGCSAKGIVEKGHRHVGRQLHGRGVAKAHSHIHARLRAPGHPPVEVALAGIRELRRKLHPGQPTETRFRGEDQDPPLSTTQVDKPPDPALPRKPFEDGPHQAGLRPLIPDRVAPRPLAAFRIRRPARSPRFHPVQPVECQLLGQVPYRAKHTLLAQRPAGEGRILDDRPKGITESGQREGSHSGNDALLPFTGWRRPRYISASDPSRRCPPSRRTAQPPRYVPTKGDRSTPRRSMTALANWAARQVFGYLHGNHLVYNTCWEDPRLDREVMRLGADDEVVLITSAGCNALDYALDGPRHIHAVDLNFRQNALLELKLAGIRRLGFEEFFALFGDGGHPDFPRWYRERLRPDLSPSARSYWDPRPHFFARRSPSDSFYHRGTTGCFARLLVRYLRLAGIHADALRLFAATSLEEQRRIYLGGIRDRMWRPAMKRALRTDLALGLIGVPKAQREHLERSCARSIADFMQDCAETVLTRLPVADNYFWRLYLFGRYSRDCCPEYLRPANFERLKGGLADRISIHTGDLTGFLEQHPERLSRFVLLDHMDWLSHHHPELLRREWQAILDRAREGARILWRSGGVDTGFVDPIEVRFRDRTRRVGDLLGYRPELAADCHARDRVHTYGSFHIADLAA